MTFNYKGWLISAAPASTSDGTDWTILLENYGTGRTHSFKVSNSITLKAAEDTAFSRVDEFERTEANIQRVDAQTKKYWGKK